MKKFLCFLFVLFAFVLTAGYAHADADSAKAFLKDVQWLGHDSFRIMGEKVIYTDPFKLKDKSITEKADIILITHEHYDHCSPEDVKKIQKPETVIITTSSCADKLKEAAKTAKPGEVIELGDIKVEAVPAYNIKKNFHPKERGDVGYIVTIKGQRIYLAGDTDRIPEMKTFKNVNIAFLPVSGTYVMSEREAVKAALDIKPDVAVPMHYGTVVGTKMNAEKFAQALKRKKIPVVLLKEE